MIVTFRFMQFLMAMAGLSVPSISCAIGFTTWFCAEHLHHSIAKSINDSPYKSSLPKRSSSDSSPAPGKIPASFLREMDIINGFQLCDRSYRDVSIRGSFSPSLLSRRRLHGRVCFSPQGTEAADHRARRRRARRAHLPPRLLQSHRGPQAEQSQREGARRAARRTHHQLRRAPRAGRPRGDPRAGRLLAAAVREQRADGELLRAAGRRVLRGAGVGRAVVGRAGEVRAKGRAGARRSGGAAARRRERGRKGGRE